jgi:hypothetical protein
VTKPRLRVFDPQQRVSMRLLRPGTQLRLPLVLLAITLGFGLLFAAQAWFAYARFYEAAMSLAPAAFQEELRQQTRSFLVVSGGLAGLYAAAIVGFGLAYTHRMVGPTVAFRRVLAALKRGDYDSRLVLRSREPVFDEVARELNGLAEKLQRQGA